MQRVRESDLGAPAGSRGLSVAPSPKATSRLQIFLECQQQISRCAEYAARLVAADGGKLVQKRLHGLIVVQKLEQKRDRNECSGKDCETICSRWIAFDQFVEVYHRDRPPSPQKRLG